MHLWLIKICTSNGEEGVYKEKNVVEDVNIVDVNEDVDRVDEMMEGVEDELGKRPRVFDLLMEASQRPFVTSRKNSDR